MLEKGKTDQFFLMGYLKKVSGLERPEFYNTQINVSSVRGRYAAPRGVGGVYNVSKAAVDMLTRTLACEWAGNNVRVNAIVPCTVETDFMPFLADLAAAARLRASFPVGRWAQPEDIVGPVLFLASKSSDFITGQIIYVDGGLTAKT